MLTIQVGKVPHNKSFVAHESFLTSRSEFFRCAMNGNWTESESRVVELPEGAPDVFAIYLDYAYTGQLTTMRKSKEELALLSPEIFIKSIENEYFDLFQLYVLAEKLQDVAAKNATLTAAIDISSMGSAMGLCRMPELCVVDVIYDGTTEGSPARRLVTDLYSTLSIKYFLELDTETLHKDFVTDLAKATEELRPVRQGRGGNVVLRNGIDAYMEQI
jgi:hypothetical protein